jgi:DNA-binding transcriptional ArsR family regulator
MLFREQPQRSIKRVKQLSPAAQVLVLAACLGRITTQNPLSATSLAERLGYTKMTLSRSLEELRQLELVYDDGNRRDGNTRFRQVGRELWKAARPALRSPVKRRIYLEEWMGVGALIAGESALAEQTNLAAPARKIWALGSAKWKEMQAHLRFRMLSEAAKESAKHEIEVWSYAPTRLTEGPSADALSIALSLSGETDDRVQIALDELMSHLW